MEEVVIRLKSELNNEIQVKFQEKIDQIAIVNQKIGLLEIQINESKKDPIIIELQEKVKIIDAENTKKDEKLATIFEKLRILEEENVKKGEKLAEQDAKIATIETAVAAKDVKIAALTEKIGILEAQLNEDIKIIKPISCENIEFDTTRTEYSITNNGKTAKRISVSDIDLGIYMKPGFNSGYHQIKVKVNSNDYVGLGIHKNNTDSHCYNEIFLFSNGGSGYGGISGVYGDGSEITLILDFNKMLFTMQGSNFNSSVSIEHTVIFVKKATCRFLIKLSRKA